MKVLKFSVYILFWSFLFYMTPQFYGSKSMLDYYDPASLIFVAVGLIFALGQFRFSEIIQAFVDAFGLSQSHDFQERYSLSGLVLKYLGNLAVLAGATGTVMGIMQSLAYFETVDALSAGVALSLLALIYGLILKFLIFYPLILSIETRVEQELEPMGANYEVV